MLVNQKHAQVIYNKLIAPDYFKMAILSPRIARWARPGQFVHLRCRNHSGPLLRRPFSFHRINQDSFEIFYKAIGPGTNLLSKKGKFDTIDVLGPLGNGFAPVTGEGPRVTILVAGGMGAAPLFAWAEELVKKREKNILVLLGAKDKKQILCAVDFKELGLKVQMATDNGSKGFRGLVTGLLKKVLRNRQYAIRPTIYACGPRAMLKEVARISRNFGACAYGALEEIMACGLGACLGCAVNASDGYKLVCKDGPVFNLQQIKW